MYGPRETVNLRSRTVFAMPWVTKSTFPERTAEYAGQVITVYDPIVHSAAEEDVDDPNSLRRTSGRFDTRYVRCHRPTVVTGGELSLICLILSTTLQLAPIRHRCR